MSESKHVVAIIGSAASGSEAAKVLAEKGAQVVVLEQNPRPFGKIEDGLPRWHAKQRRNEYKRITDKLAHENIEFVPLTKIGVDISLEEIIDGWGFSAVLLANGSWRDRPLEVPDVGLHLGQGMAYQNPFVYWFNHYPEKSYAGETYETPDGSAAIGGGLASIDVVKILAIENAQRALKERGIEISMAELEHGIPKALAKHDLEFKDLGLAGPTLFYRRRIKDMPLAQYPDGATDEQKAKTEKNREKIIGNVVKKFCINVEDQSLPTEFIVENGRIVGLKLIKTEVDGRKATPIPGTEFEFRCQLIVSSIGSIPVPMAGINMNGAFYDIDDWDTGKFRQWDHVWGIGNVVTGQGNIRKSLQHGAFVAKHVAENYLGVGDGELDVETIAADAEEAAAAATEQVATAIAARPKLTAEKVEAILALVRQRQAEVDYEGDIHAWLERMTPADME